EPKRPTNLAEALDALVQSAARAARGDPTVRTALDLDAERINAGLVAFVLRALLATDSDGPLADGIAAVPAWARRAGAESPLFVDPELPFTTRTDLATWAETGEVRAIVAAVERSKPYASARDASVVYEELLELRVRRLDAASVCLKPARTWISARDVLRES